MCGICGIVSADADPAEQRRQVQSMNDALAHRGPNGEGVWGDDDAMLGHRRLAVIDLSSNGKQPMLSDDGRYVLVCNGEIYNYRDLRSAIGDNYPFVSNTDVELILPLFKKHGIACVDHLVGMFAFAIWDRYEKRLHLFRDRIGEKPLYYAADGRRFAFASEIKALLELPWVDHDLNEEAIPNMLVYQATPAPITFYKGISALPAACRLEWKEGEHHVSQYWNMVFERDFSLQFEDALDEYGALVEQSIDGCSVSDAPLGVMLSGGVDSGTVAAVVSKKQKNVNTYCISAEAAKGEDPEIERARRMAEAFGTHHSEFYFQTNELPRLPFVLNRYDQPFGNYACFYADTLAELMSRKETVVLSGNAADEVFAGYRGYNATVELEGKYRLARLLPRWLGSLIPGDFGDKIGRFIQGANTSIADWRQIALDRGASYLFDKMTTSSFGTAWKEYSPGRHVKKHVVDSNATSLIQSVMYSDLMVYHHHGHAIMCDIAGMGYGLEYRAPFLDHRLIEFSGRLPEKWLIPSSTDSLKNKYIMKEYLALHVPHEWVYVPKMGFGYGIDFSEYFKGVWRKPIEKQVLEGKYLELGIFTREGAKWGLDHSFATAWMLLSFSIWADMNLFGDAPERVSERLAAFSRTD